jgi:hypothetical protein
MLRRIFGPKREESMGGRIKLCTEKLHNLITSLNIPKDNKIKRLELVRISSTHVKRKPLIQVLVRETEMKKPLGR